MNGGRVAPACALLLFTKALGRARPVNSATTEAVDCAGDCAAESKRHKKKIVLRALRQDGDVRADDQHNRQKRCCNHYA